MKKHNYGFTLAEVLITLVIIGIIAAMTIPTLMNKTNEQETVVAVKRAYSTLGQAFQRMVADNGELNPSFFGSTAKEATKNFGDNIVKYLNVQRNCQMEAGTDCFSSLDGGMYKNLDGSDWVNFNASTGDYKIRLTDGSSIGVYVIANYYAAGGTEALQTTFGHIHVDINGDKGPNVVGKDDFRFWITKYGILPSGTPDDWGYPYSNCVTDGRACTAWVLSKGNLDYLKKDSISW